MKVEKTSSTRSPRAVAAAYAKRVEAAAAAETVAPVTASASVMGIPEDEFTPRVRDAIMTLMSEVAELRRELQKTRDRLDEVEKTADRDQLLPLLNRRAFVRELTRTIAYTGRYTTPATLLYFDLNGFKAVNDTYGHTGGDAVLGHFATVLLDNVRDSDVVGRLGGDEFGVLLSHAGLEQGMKKADKLAETLNASPAEWDGKSIPIGFSYGAFELKGEDSADGAIARADEAMYANKRTTR